MQKFSKSAVTALLKEYRCAIDAAEGVEIANGLRAAFQACVDAGEMTEADYLCACAQGLDEIRELAGTDAKRHLRQAKIAKDKLVLANRGLVRIVAKSVLGAAAQNPDNLEEAEQEGAMGVMRAVEVFDETRGLWSVCARAWIRYYVQTCQHHQRDFPVQRNQRMPPEVVDQVKKFRALRGREPEPRELTFKDKPVTQEQWQAWTERAQVSSFEATNTHRNYHESDSLDARGSVDFIADERTNPDLLIANANLSEKLQATLNEMSPRHADIARAIFVDGDSIPEVVSRFQISDRRIHEIKRMLADRLRKVLQP